ncbi:MAG TPA: trypsin-like peptidase domain-containing protein [Tepidisphaeraceae bacterium]|jgi:serine protease Do|nr:trypsin-like peptidase domain-containing protein [Tepidisphaeraceae bacterium]
MRGLRKQLGVLSIAALSVTGGFFGYNLIENVQFARAADEVKATRQQLGTVEDMSTVFRQVGKVVEPSVVNINVTKKVPGMGGRQHMFDEDQLRKMFPNGELPRGFRFRGGNNNNNNNGDGTDNGDGDSDIEVGTGSGVIMEVAGGYGYIMTNNHVAGGAQKMTITLADGRQIENATLVGADPKSDIAVVKIKADRLIPAKWGNSDELQKGDWIMAFGSPFGYVGSMTHGIVSALHRDAVGIIQGGYENFIQVDAPINPGNSGGPLVNIRGEVVGVNTAIASRSGGFQGIGFAVPSNQAHVVYDSLKAHGKVVRGYLGVAIKDLSAEDPDFASSVGFKGTKGAVVHEISPSGPANEKLHEEDIITAVNGKDVADSQELRNAIADIAPDEDAKLSVFRDGKSKEVDIKVAEQPADMAAALRGGPGSNDQGNTSSGETANTNEAFGMTLETLNNDLATQAGITNVKKGAIVTDVDANSPAAKKGIRPGDVITRIGNQSIATAAEATAAFEKADSSKGVRLIVTNNETTKFVVLKPKKSGASKSDQ